MKLQQKLRPPSGAESTGPQADTSDFLQVARFDAQQIDEPENRRLLADCAGEVGDLYLRMGALLSVRHARGWFDRHRTFQEWCDAQPDLGGYDKCMWLVRIYEQLTELGLPWRVFADIPWTKLTVLFPSRERLLTVENARDWAGRARRLSRANSSSRSRRRWVSLTQTRRGRSRPLLRSEPPGSVRRSRGRRREVVGLILSRAPARARRPGPSGQRPAGLVAERGRAASARAVRSHGSC